MNYEFEFFLCGSLCASVFSVKLFLLHSAHRGFTALHREVLFIHFIYFILFIVAKLISYIFLLT